jgi:hypothetical protein
MALRFVGIDPETDVQHCPAVFVDEDTGDLVFTGSRFAGRGSYLSRSPHTSGSSTT